MTMQPEGSSRPRLSTVSKVLIGVLIGLIGVAIGYGVASLAPLSPGSDSSKGLLSAASTTDVRAAAERVGVLYELDSDQDLAVQMREDAAEGSISLEYRTNASDNDPLYVVTTYFIQNGGEILSGVSDDGAFSQSITESGAIVVVNKETPLSTYFSFPDANFQVEVYSVKDNESLKLVTQGDIKLVG